MIKRMLRMALCLALILSLLLPANAFAAKARTISLVKVTGDYVRVHSLPSGTEGEIIGKLRAGTKLFYLDNVGGWIQVCSSRGVSGYIYKTYLSYYGAARLDNIYYVQSSSLKMYSKPSTSSSKTGTLSQDELVILYQASGRWGYVRTPNGDGGCVLLSGLKKAV